MCVCVATITRKNSECPTSNCFRKSRKGLLPIFHAILFAENEIVHHHHLVRVARDVARGMGEFTNKSFMFLRQKINVSKMHTFESILPKIFQADMPPDTLVCV